MNLITGEGSAPELTGEVPSVWRVLYEFARQICVGCAVTFGPRPPNETRQVDQLKNDAYKVELNRTALAHNPLRMT